MKIGRTWANSHNIVALLDKDKVPEEFTEMIDFINATSIRYALTVNPTIVVSHIKQFWHSAIVKTLNGEQYIKAKVDGQKVLVSESIIRETLFFEDDEGILCLSDSEIFVGLGELGNEKKNQSLKIQKGFFSSPWKLLIHVLSHCLSSKTTGWNEFNASITSAMICLST